MFCKKENQFGKVTHSKMVIHRKRKNGRKMQITWEKVLLLVVLLLLFPELHDQMYLARSRSVRMEILLNSEGMNYQLGERISKRNLKQNFSRGYQCMTDDWLGDMAKIPWSEGYFVEKDIQGVQSVGIRGFPSPKFSLKRIVDISLNAGEYKLYGIYPDMEYEKAEQCLLKHGYIYECFGYWKNDVKIVLNKRRNNRISSIIIKLYTHRQHQKIKKAYQKSVEETGF